MCPLHDLKITSRHKDFVFGFLFIKRTMFSVSSLMECWHMANCCVYAVKSAD